MGDIIKFNPDNNEEFAEKLMECNDQRELQEIVDFFNMHMMKKDLIRANSYSNLQDMLINQASERVSRHSGEFSNKDLLDYINSIQKFLDKSDQISEFTVPQSISIQNNITIEGPQLDKDSRDRVRDAIQMILAKQVEDGEFVVEDDN